MNEKMPNQITSVTVEHGTAYVGFTLSQATKTLRERRGIALLCFRPLH